MPTDDGPSRFRHWLCIAQSFPPVNRSGTFRTLGFVRHLERLGWRATVITARPEAEAIDDSLAELVPAETAIIPTRSPDILKSLTLWRNQLVGRRVRMAERSALSIDACARTGVLRSIKDLTTQLVSTPDSRIGWIHGAVRAGLRALRDSPAEVIYSTSPCTSAHLIAMFIQRLARVPWVADFRDPWRDNGFRRNTLPLVDRWDEYLETCVLKRAHRVICNTYTAREQLVTRRPWIARKCHTIANGIDFDLLTAVAGNRSEPQDCFVLAHCGQFYGPRSPRPWFRALNQIRLRDPARGGKVRFLSVGCESYDGEPLPRIAQQEGVADMVRVFPQQSHCESLALAAGADAVVVAGSLGAGAHLQVPNKLYEYLGLRKPIVAAVDERSPVSAILNAANARASVCSPGDASSIALSIERIMSYRQDRQKEWSGIGSFDRALRAAELAEVFDALTQPAVRPRLGRTMSFPAAQLPAVPIVRPGSLPRQARSECSMPR